METESELMLKKRIEELETELEYYKHYDTLTHIYSKSTFYEIVACILKQEPKRCYDIICADIEHFKLINDVYGTDLGDRLLIHIANDLKQHFDHNDMCCSRIGPDIFAICIPREQSENAAKQIYQIFHSYSNEMEIIPAIGIYQIETADISVSLMCDRAIMAANSIKGIYMNHISYYHDSMRNILFEEQELLNHADSALANKEFVIYMQPKCNMNTGKITGAEALVRWNHPQKGLIPPKDFIPLFERNGFITKLDQYVWEECARWLKEWSKSHEVIPISVNISRLDIFHLDVQTIFENLLHTYELDPSWMELEITESAYSTRSDEIILSINHLMSTGFTVLMDDFGSGYSSLNILKDINIDVLKLDMRFLDSQDRKSKDIIESVVHMAKWLNLKIIAEGVENKEQIDFLLKVGCHHAQGYYYYKPMPIADYETLLLQKDLVDHQDHYVSKSQEMVMIRIKDLFHEDIVSETLLNNILGAVAIYRYDGVKLHLQKANESYYHLRDHHIQTDILKTIHPEDEPLFVETIHAALDARDHGAEVTLRVFCKEHKHTQWLRIRLFFLSEIKGDKILYASISSADHYMQTLQALRMSEKSFHIAMQTSNITIFELDIPTKTARYAKHTQDAFGLDSCIMNAPEGFIEEGSVCEGYEQVFREMYDNIYAGEEHASCVIKANMGDGSIVWNRITLTAIKDNEGNSIKAVGLVENVTKEIDLQLKLQTKEN